MDEITDAILTNPDLLEQAQGRDDRYNWIITKRDDGNYGVWNGRYFAIMTHEQLYPSTPFHETESAKAYLATLYH